MGTGIVRDSSGIRTLTILPSTAAGKTCAFAESQNLQLMSVMNGIEWGGYGLRYSD